MFFVIQYARVMHAIRRFLSRQGILQSLSSRAGESDGGLWFRSLFSVLDFEDFQTLDTPWWTLATGRKVRDFLRSTPGARVLEWGSGASTVWLGKRSAEVFSIESDANWAEMVRDSVPPHVQILTPEIPVLGKAERILQLEGEERACADTNLTHGFHGRNRGKHK